MTCLSCENDQSFSIIGGNSDTITFDATNSFGNIVNLSGCDAFFSYVPYTDRYLDCAIRKPCEIKESSEGNGIYDNILVQLSAAETCTLSGKYVYQLTVKNNESDDVFVFQGTMIVKKNIDSTLITEGV